MDNKTILEQVSIIEDEAYNFKPIESVAKITDSMSHCSDVVTMQIYMRGLASYLREIKEKNTSVWDKLYRLTKTLEKEQDAEEPTIDTDEPVTEDDLPFDGKEEKE